MEENKITRIKIKKLLMLWGVTQDDANDFIEELNRMKDEDDNPEQENKFDEINNEEILNEYEGGK